MVSQVLIPVDKHR